MSTVNIPYPKWVYELAKYAAGQLESGLAVLDPRDLWTLLPPDVQTAGRVLNHYELLTRPTLPTPSAVASPDPTPAVDPNPVDAATDTAVLPLFAAIPQPTSPNNTETAQ